MLTLPSVSVITDKCLDFIDCNRTKGVESKFGIGDVPVSYFVVFKPRWSFGKSITTLRLGHQSLSYLILDCKNTFNFYFVLESMFYNFFVVYKALPKISPVKSIALGF